MAKKRSRQSHTGSVYQSGGIWYAAVMVGGKRKRARAGSKAEANAKLADLRKSAEVSLGLDPSTFGGFRLRWLEHIKVNKSLKTSQSYQYAVDHFSSLDSMAIGRITGQMIQQIVDGLQGRTRQQAFDKCKQMLQIAVRWKCLAENPMEHLDRPAHEKASVDPFEISEVERIIAHTKADRYGAAIALAFACGLRGGELWGLQWADLKGNELTIQRQACESAGRLEIKAPKPQREFAGFCSQIRL